MKTSTSCHLLIGLNERAGEKSITLLFFQIYYWIGWKPDASQPQPLKPQKSDVSLKDLDRLDEVIKLKTEEKDRKK